jgi:V/A-type H+-transporting ATPase subunit I
MVHLRIQVPGRDGAAVTREIAAKGLLHLIDIAHGTSCSGTALPASTALLGRFRDAASSIRRVRKALSLPPAKMSGPLPNPPTGEDFENEYEQIASRLEPVRSDVEDAVRRRTRASEDKAFLALRLDRAERLTAAGVDPSRLGLHFAHVRIALASADDLRQLTGHLAPAPFALIPLDDRKPRLLAALVVPSSGRERLEAALRAVPLEMFDLSQDASSLPATALRQRLDAAAAAEIAAAQALAELAPKHRDGLADLARRVDVAVLLLQAQTMFAMAGRFLVISGWIPQDRADELSAAVARVTSQRAVVTVERPEDVSAAYGPALSVPILHRNPLLLRPFDRLVQVYGIPSYGEVQPTAFFALSFLLLFGLMFGDIGHGLVLMAAGYCAFRYMPRFLDYAILLMEAGTASACFGAVYGTVFGIETPWRGLADPMHDVKSLAVAAIGIGVVLVSGGVALNIVNSWRAGERVAALTSTRGLFGALVYWSALALAARAVLPAGWVVPDAVIVGLAGAGLALIASRPLIVRALGANQRRREREGAAPRSLAALESSIELVDALFSYLANTMSFVRVAAFAAVHAGVLVAIFALADTFSQFRFGGLVSIAVLVAGNIAVILLEGLTVTVQVLRLEYYEFFSRFFRGGGEAYRPLMLRPNGVQVSGSESCLHDSLPDTGQREVCHD